MQDNSDRRRSQLWYSTLQVDEYFRMLGGSGCYPGYADWHVPALMTVAMDDYCSNSKLSYEHMVKRLISHRMWEQTDRLPTRALDLIVKTQSMEEDISWFISSVTERYPMSYRPYEKEEWLAFLDERKQLQGAQS